MTESVDHFDWDKFLESLDWQQLMEGAYQCWLGFLPDHEEEWGVPVHSGCYRRTHLNLPVTAEDLLTLEQKYGSYVESASWNYIFKFTGSHLFMIHPTEGICTTIFRFEKSGDGYVVADVITDTATKSEYADPKAVLHDDLQVLSSLLPGNRFAHTGGDDDYGKWIWRNPGDPGYEAAPEVE